MRIGQNPAKYANQVARPERITVAVLNYIPFLSGFYAETLDVLKLSLDTLQAGADLPHDLLVFDNGSCPEVQDYLLGLERAGSIQYLLLADKNLGKGGAWNIILSGAPGEIIAYGDSDIYYYPGWLSESVRVLETYPGAGMVTSRPFRTREDLFSATLDWAARTPGVDLETGCFIDWEDFSSFEFSLGNSEEAARERYQATRDFRLTYRGVPAFAGSSHWQFVAYKSVLQQFLPFQMDRPMGQVRQLDTRVNEAGLLRLMTGRPLVQNMSNTLPPEERKKAGLPDRAARQGKAARRFFEFPAVKKPLLAAYDWIFRLYNT